VLTEEFAGLSSVIHKLEKLTANFYETLWMQCCKKDFSSAGAGVGSKEARAGPLRGRFVSMNGTQT
jgi:hypothetical protein